MKSTIRGKEEKEDHAMPLLLLGEMFSLGLSSFI